MADLDPEEQKLIAEAMFDTANEELIGGPLDFVEEADTNGNKDDGENVPTSKVQFPIRRSKSTRKRKIVCAMITLLVIFGALLSVYLILKAKTFSFELNLAKGQVMHYRVTQEQTFEGLKTVHNSFTEDVFVEIVNKTGHKCWMKVFLKTLPGANSGPHAFLVHINLGGQNSVDIDDEKRLKVFTPWKKQNTTVDYYVLNLLTQLLPVVKIDYFEVLLSQITTRNHEIVLENSKFFTGDGVMKQNIRMNKDDILVTSKIDPEGFSSFSQTSNPSAHFLLSFEEDTSISKSTGMISKNDMEISAKVPISGEGAKVHLFMRFKSSVRLVNKEKKIPIHFKREFTFNELHKIRKPKEGLLFFSPTLKKYNEKANVVEAVKGMLNFTLPQKSVQKPKKNKNMEEFAKSFHQIVQPGIETNFAEVKEETQQRHRFPDRFVKTTTTSTTTTPLPTQTTTGNRYTYNNDDDNNDDDSYNGPPQTDNDDDYEGDDRIGWNRFGQPNYPNGDEPGFDDSDYYNPSEDNGEKLDTNTSPKADMLDEDKKKDTLVSNEKKSASKSKPEKTKSAHSKKVSEKAISQALYQEAKTSQPKKSEMKSNSMFNKSKKKENSKLNEKVNKEMPTQDETMTNTNRATVAPQNEEKGYFDRMFDELMKNDEDDQIPQPQSEIGGFKLSHLFPSFSFSSHFPFIHIKWKNSGKNSHSLKKRSLENPGKQKSKMRREVHRDKRRLFDDEGPAPYYSGRDLESVWDVIAHASITKHPKQTVQVFQHRILGLEVNGDLEHEVNVVDESIKNKPKRKGWEIQFTLLLTVNNHKFKVLGKKISMKEIEERFLRNSKPKKEYGTVHAGTLVLCTPFFYIENICVELQLGFVLHVSHSIDYLSKEYPIELSIFFKHLVKADVTITSHMTSLLGSHGLFGYGPLFGAKVPLEIRFSEERNLEKWCSIAHLKSKLGDFFDSAKDLSQWDCPIMSAVASDAFCPGLNKNATHKAPARLWYNRKATTKMLHFLNSC